MMPRGATETRTLKVGEKAPDFHLKAHQGNMVSLSDFKGKNLFMAFYPLAWTPV